jgi:hypothetical protein
MKSPERLREPESSERNWHNWVAPACSMLELYESLDHNSENASFFFNVLFAGSLDENVRHLGE